MDTVLYWRQDAVDADDEGGGELECSAISLANSTKRPGAES